MNLVLLATMVMMESFDNWLLDQLQEQQLSCNQYAEKKNSLDWLLLIMSSFAQPEQVTQGFEEEFVSALLDDFENLIQVCLNNEQSEDTILQSLRKVMVSVD